MINAVPSGNSPTSANPPAKPNLDNGVGFKPSNTKPDTQHKPPASDGIKKPDTDKISTPPGMHPDLNTGAQPGKANPTAAHGQTGRYAGNLAQKVQGKDAGSGAPTPPNTLNAPPLTPFPDKSLDEINQAHQQGGGPKFAKTAIISALVLGLVIAGSGAGYYLTQQNQDIREQAASEEVTQTETISDQQDWIAFNAKWQDVMADKNNTWQDYVAYAQGEGARYECDAPIMTVGSETLYGCDLNALFILYEPQTYIQAQSISPQDSTLNSVLDGMITNSALLQEGQKQNLITLSANVYNSPNKNTIERLDMVKMMRSEFAGQFEKTVDFEVVTIYFHNQIDPQIPLAEAQAAAKAKMDVLYERLKSGEITMEEAGAEIAADNITGDTTGVSLAQLDRLYDKNAYVAHQGHKFNSRIFKDPVYDDELRSLGEGQMSTVRLCQDYKFTQEELAQSEADDEDVNAEMVDSCYLIFKVNKINYGLLPQDSSEQDVESYLQSDYSAKTTKNNVNLEQ